MTNLTGHMVVKNEELWIKPAILSVIDQLDTLLVWDTGSTDKTIEIINSINSKKIQLKKFEKADRKKLIFLRNQQIKATKTPWFILVDGDEIWPKKNFEKLINSIKKAKPNTVALVNKTRNCIGDIYHYLPESKGRYKIGPWEGHLNIRAIKNTKGLIVVGEYPNEAYQLKGKSLQDQPENLEFADTWYLHTTHLKRSRLYHQLNVIDRMKKTKLLGKRISLKPSEIPEVLS